MSVYLKFIDYVLIIYIHKPIKNTFFCNLKLLSDCLNIDLPNTLYF